MPLVTRESQNRTIVGLRWWFLFLLAAGLLLLASFYFDGEAQTWIAQHQNDRVKNFMHAVSRWGDWPEHVALGLLLLGVARWRGNRKWQRIFLSMILACALAGVGARVIKIATGRARPSVQTEAGWSGPRLSAAHNSFPSGHTACSTAFFATLAIASWRISAAFLWIPILIAFSRIYIAAHYVSDLVGAAIVGLIAAFLVARWFDLRSENRRSNI